MKRLEMHVTPRESTGKRHGRALRRTGFIPAVVYGGDRDNASVTVAENQIEGGENALAIIKEVQYDALGEVIHHVDFFRITEGEPIQVTIPITATGLSEGEQEGGVVEHLNREVRIECLPRDIPEAVTFDISTMAMGDSLHLSDVPPPAGVTFLDSLDMALVVVKAPRMARAEPEVEVVAEEGEEGEAAEGEEEPGAEGAPPAEGEETPPAGKGSS
jgi:large subunit ribosomal protein L25